MALPLAYFLTWCCYGQRLHGDERGSVDREHNQRGTPMLGPDPARERRERALMEAEKFTLTRAMRDVADAAMCELCEERRWLLIARNPRSTHVHAVVNCRGQVSPERATAWLKGRITRRLGDAGLVGPKPRVWERHGSMRWINHEPGLYAAIVYVNEWQSGSKKRVLEEHRKLVKERLKRVRAWLKESGLPEDGRTVVLGETEEERSLRVRTSPTARLTDRIHDEPRTE